LPLLLWYQVSLLIVLLTATKSLSAVLLPLFAVAVPVPWTPVTFTLQKDFEVGLFEHSYLAVILF
jgi:hypothetical protein